MPLKNVKNKQQVNAATRKGKSSAGKRIDLDNRFFRSKTEANYARYLNALINGVIDAPKVGAHAEEGIRLVADALQDVREWEYEPDTFRFPVQRGQMYYIPDFKVTKKDGSVEYHEVKGWLDAESRTKLNRMKKYYPTVKVVLITTNDFRKLTKNANILIKNWE